MKRLPSAVPTGGQLLGAEIAVIADRLKRLQGELEADVRERSRFLRTDVPDQGDRELLSPRPPRRFS